MNNVYFRAYQIPYNKYNLLSLQQTIICLSSRRKKFKQCFIKTMSYGVKQGLILPKSRSGSAIMKKF